MEYNWSGKLPRTKNIACLVECKTSGPSTFLTSMGINSEEYQSNQLMEAIFLLFALIRIKIIFFGFVPSLLFSKKTCFNAK